MLTASVSAMDFMCTVSKTFLRTYGEKHSICLLKGFESYKGKMTSLLLLVLLYPSASLVMILLRQITQS